MTETIDRLESTLDVFQAMLDIAQLCNISKKEVCVIMTTLCRMAREETVQAHYLRGSLAAHIPGTLQAAARAMGLRVPIFVQRLNAGTIHTEEFFARFAAEIDKTREHLEVFILNSAAQGR